MLEFLLLDKPPWRWSVRSIAGLLLWLRADKGVYKDAAMTTPAVDDDDVLLGWADGSGRGTHGTQATAGNAAALKLGIVGGMPVVRFDGVDSYLSLGKVWDFDPTNDSFSVFVVALVATGDTGTLISQAKATERQWALFTSDNKLMYRLGTANEVGSDIVTNTPKILSFTCDAANGKTWVDGSPDIVDGALQWTDADVDVLIGARRKDDNTDFGYPLTGDIAEIVVASPCFSDADREALESYAAARYGISVG